MDYKKIAKHTGIKHCFCKQSQI